MKILQVPFGFYPDAVGGTEIYVEQLAYQFKYLKVEAMIAAPGEMNSAYTYNGLQVHRYAVPETNDIREIYGAGNVTAAQNFSKILDQEQPDLVHLHAFTRGVSVLLVDAAKQRGIPGIFTYHTPTVSCIRGTLLRFGRESCDGLLDLKTCTHCQLENLGVPNTVGAMLKNIPPTVGIKLGDYGFSGGAWNALRMTELVKQRQAATRSLMEKVDRVVVLCDWVKALLQRNGVPNEKMILSRHGLSELPMQSSASSLLQKPLKLLYLGRIDPTKGIELIIRALCALPDVDIQLDIYGIVQSGSEVHYQELLKLINGESRIQFFPPKPRSELMMTLQNYHALVVPSRIMETGPLVVLEAFAAGIPVIGSKLGGIAELVQDAHNGLLVEGLSVQAWQTVIQQIAQNPAILDNLRQNITAPRSMANVASDMLQLYEHVLN